MGARPWLDPGVVGRKHLLMRSLAFAAMFTLSLLALPARAEDGAKKLQLKVGEVQPLTGFRPLCDDPSIVEIDANGKGLIKGLKPGTTLCSVSIGSPLGTRQVYQVIVVPPPPKGRGKGPSGGGA